MALSYLLLGVSLLLAQSSSANPTDHSLQKRGIGNDIYSTWAGVYTNIITDYISDLYPDIIETFVGATVKILAWASFGTLLVLKGSFFNSAASTSYTSSYRSLTEQFSGRATEDASGKLNYTLPYLGDILGVDLTFPVDNSMQDCYGGRESCVTSNFQDEVGHLVEKMGDAKELFNNWWGLGEKIINMVDNGEESLDEDF